MPATFLFPDTLIADPAPLRHDAVQAGERLLRRARVLNRTEDESAVPAETPYEQWLRRELRVPDAASLEAASAYADDADPAQWRLSPVHLHLGVDHILLTDPAGLTLSIEEARELAAAAQPTLADAGMTLHVVTAARWYLRSNEPLQLRCHGWRVAAGRSIEAYLPSGPSARRWRQVLNEIQMCWHEHPVNRRRAANGAPAVNSLWIDGRAGAATRFDYDLCVTDMPGLRGLATEAAARGAGAPALLPTARLRDALAERGKRVLVAFDPTDVDATDANTTDSDLMDSDLMDSDNRQAAPDARLALHWQRLVATLGQPGVLAARAAALLAGGPARIVLTGDRRIVELSLGARDQWAFMRRTQLASCFEPGERGLLRGAA